MATNDKLIGGIAQPVEQWPEKPCVPSSNLGPATIYLEGYSNDLSFSTHVKLFGHIFILIKYLASILG